MGLLLEIKKEAWIRYLSAKNLQPFVPEKFKEKSLDQAAIILDIGGRKAHCYEGEDIVDIIGMYLDARKKERIDQKKILLPSQEHLADQAEIIIKSLAKVGIAGLIDEATGYQYVREKDALQAYLEKIIRKEIAAWVQMFPNEFFRNKFIDYMAGNGVVLVEVHQLSVSILTIWYILDLDQEYLMTLEK